jgi:hypothetical protein
MKKEKLYKTLKILVQDCLDVAGLPKKPCIKKIHEAKDVIDKYEKAKKREDIITNKT